MRKSSGTSPSITANQRLPAAVAGRTFSAAASRLISSCSGLIRRLRRFSQIREDQAFDFEAGAAEIEQQAALQARGFEIVQELGVFHAGKRLERLHFNNYALIA